VPCVSEGVVSVCLHEHAPCSWNTLTAKQVPGLNVSLFARLLDLDLRSICRPRSCALRGESLLHTLSAGLCTQQVVAVRATGFGLLT